MVIAEVWLVSDPKYTVKIAGDNYFSLVVAGVVGIFFVFLVLAIKFGYGIQFKTAKIPLGKATTAKMIQKKN